MNSLRTFVLGTVMVLASWAAFHGRADSADAKEAKPLIHGVYFSLKDNSPAAKTKLVEACKKYLAPEKHPGMQGLGVGILAEEVKREVNDRDFDIHLYIHFADKAAHDKYQEAPLHKQFIDENKDNWKKARVFDSVEEWRAFWAPQLTVDDGKPRKPSGIAHDVYFSLKESSPAARKKLVEACGKLKSFKTGPAGGALRVALLCDELKRDVNDRDFDVSLYTGFADRAEYDTFQDSAAYKEFIEKNKESLKKVRVFDSLPQ